MAYDPDRSVPPRTATTPVAERGSNVGIIIAVVAVLAIVALFLFGMGGRDTTVSPATTEAPAADTSVDVDVAPPAADTGAADTAPPATGGAAPATDGAAPAAPADATGGGATAPATGTQPAP